MVKPVPPLTKLAYSYTIEMNTSFSATMLTPLNANLIALSSLSTLGFGGFRGFGGFGGTLTAGANRTFDSLYISSSYSFSSAACSCSPYEAT
jgi:hypothetical protein